MTYRTSLTRRLLGVALATSITGIAGAQLFTDAEINYQSVFGSTVQYSTNNGADWSANQLAGFITWTNTNASATANLFNYGGATGGRVNTICGELVFLADPQLVDGYLSNNVGLGAAINRAGAIVGDNYNDGGINSYFDAFNTGSAQTASAFQAAVWAGRYGGGSALDMVTDPDQVRVGDFRIRKAAGVGGTNWATFKTTMAGYYNSAYNHGFNGVSLFLDAAPNGSSQDQFTVLDGTHPVPEPFTLALGAASIGLALRRRKR